ncbi:MAG: ABC-F family ATP-binding cassette domain-containing protein [Chlamydiae bacterium]|nr:ABC-F family ATP-binding cassette domain-containing protein [Chlamydiota bacterium]MBI3267088.1 ABC-F family ATP-binding cassette domain-containing protein [Chlamydiota bacterium]
MPAQLQIKNLYKSYGPHIIFEGATASFSTDQKIGVIGRNGAGKSTLCKILTGQEDMEEGEICKSADLRLSYLEQHDAFGPDETVLEFLKRYTQKEGWKCGKVASRFQIKNDLLTTPVKNLSGGYQTRLKLTAMLLPEPNFLILDEPTNYLDLNTLILLENFLLDFDGGYLIVSHDREFLKRTCTSTLEAQRGNLFSYPGNVEDYLDFKEAQKEQRESIHKSITSKKKQLQTFVDRFGANAATAALAQSKRKLIEKLDSQTIEVGHPMGSVRIKIPSVDRKYGVALRCEDLAIGYPSRLVASEIHLELERGDRVAVLGENGQGKTTFMRTIADHLSPKSGTYRWGAGTKIGYYAQHVLSMLHPLEDVYTHLKKNAAQGILHQDILNMAGSFLFKGDDVEKKVSVLSGGEKARLCLAGLLLSKCNVLLLDEPTNHLDFETVEALGLALKNYEGTVFFISHDRTFVNLIATKILDVKGGRIIRYPGTYEEYVYVLEREARSGGPREEVQDPKVSRKDSLVQEQEKKLAPSSSEAPKKLTYVERKSLQSELKKLEKRLQRVEGEMNLFRAEKDAILKQFAENPTSWKRKLSDRAEMLTKLVNDQEEIWLALQQKTDDMRERLG